MLPGFRFLFAAVVLSLSLVVFGLGAVSLLRSAHEEFASLPIGRAPRETVFNQGYDNQPRLAMLRVETPAKEDAPAAVSKEPASTDLTSSDLSVDPAPLPDANVAASTVAPADAPVHSAMTTSPTEPSKPSAEPEKITALTPAPAQNDAAPLATPQPAPPQAIESALAAAAETAAPAASAPASETAVADKPVAATPAPMVTALLAPDQTTAAASNASPATSEATAAAPASEAATPPASASDTTQVAALTDPATTEELTPSEPIPAGMVPIPRQRPSPVAAKTTAQKKKKINRPHRVAIRIQQPPPARTAPQSGALFN